MEEHIELILNKDIWLLFSHFLNFIFALFCLYSSSILFFIHKDRFEKIYQFGLMIISFFYLILLFRFTVLESVDWEVDVFLWTIFESLVFIFFLVRNRIIRNECE